MAISYLGCSHAVPGGVCLGGASVREEAGATPRAARSLRHALLGLVALIVALGATTGTAAAVPGGVAYIDGGHVQIAKLDGTKKVQLSDGLAWWNAVAQSDTGGVLATKNEPGKISQFSLFQTWDASGNPARFGPLNHDASGASLAMPLTLELTASNGLMLYGYTAQFFGPPLTTRHGYYAQTTTTTGVFAPLNQTALRWPTLAGDRVVGTSDESTISVLNADQNFVGSETTLWPNIDVSGAGPGATLHRTSLSTNGTVLAAEVVFETDSSNGSYEQERIAMIRTPGLGQEPLPGDCWLPVAGKGTNPSVSQDGTLIAWKDDQGVKIAGVPDFSGAELCNLTRPPVVISATGSEPALGPIDVDAIWAARNPALGAPAALGAPGNPASVALVALSVTPPARVTAKALTDTRGITLTVATPVSGKVRVALTIQPRLVGRKGSTPIVIATGTATAAAAGKLKVRVRPTPIGRTLTAKLRGKRVTITVRIGTLKTTKLIRLW